MLGNVITFTDVMMTMYWTSRQDKQGWAFSISAINPAANGAAALVPVWPSVHPSPPLFVQSVVVCRQHTFNTVKQLSHQNVNHTCIRELIVKRV